MSDQQNQKLSKFISQLKQSLLNFLQEAKHVFPSQFLTKVNKILQHKAEGLIQHQNLSLGNKLLEINELCLYQMAQKLSDLMSQQQNRSVQSSARSNQNQIQYKDYEVLEQAVQKAEQQIRKHIGIQHQMKICLEEVQDELQDLTQLNEQLKKQNSFLKKELSSAKKKQIQIAKKLEDVEQKLEFYEEKLKLSKPTSKLNTEPDSTIVHNTSRKQLKKSFESQKQKSCKKTLLSKGNPYSKLGSRKTSKLGLLQNEIDINLHNFITLSTQIKRQQPVTRTQGKQTFWNKRLKKKQITQVSTSNNDYSTIQNYNNRSLNISPRHMKRQLKQKQIKEVYATNSREIKRSNHHTINQDTVTKKKQRRQYSNADAYQIRRSVKTNNHNYGPDRSKSVVY